ncbi:MAG: hypothetical protein EAY79_11300 [Runella slithyformis]|nr:MAG: hypothetical protein EAY79_11300 [Runella slithyformis]
MGGSHEVDFVQRGGANYTFYDDGSLKSDANEQIQNINYDTFLQQPTQVQLTDGRTINHYYDGGGKLLKTVYSTGETWEFGNGLIYKNGQPYQLSMAEGRATYQNGTWQNEFQYQDHLGNTRVSFKANGNQLEKVAETVFDPWGVVLNGLGQQNAFQNRFEFLNREKESTFGLNTIRLGARGYNPTIGRFDETDPVIEGQEHLSLYQYGWNNPVLMSDPDGREPCCGGVVDFLTGAGQAIIEDVAGSTPIQANPGDAGAYNSGRTAGHLVAAIAGAGESALGLLGLGASAVGEVGSLGLATPAIAVTAAGSLALTAHGVSTANNALNNLRNDKGRVEVSGDKTYDRVKPRKGTVNKVTENQPKNAKGEMLDPNTGQAIDPKRKDLGHKPGQEWRKRKEMHKEKGSTRKEVIEAENNPDLYQWEDRSSNRSRTHEKRN